MANKILCVIREPFIDRIPSLKSLLILLSESDKSVEILTTTDEKFVKPTFLNQNIHLHQVSQRTNREYLPIPTTVKLLFSTFKFVLFNNYQAIIGAGSYGMIASYFVSKLLRKKFIAFCIEFPQIITETCSKLTLSDKIEHYIIKNADHVITHDDYHLNFLVTHLDVNESKILTLPNGTIGEAKKIDSTFLQKRLGLDQNDVVILHSGGVGPWFLCKELASSAKQWPDNWKLVFHASHNIKSDPYAQELLSESSTKNILFSLSPVATNELDDLVGSAHIGVALYSIEKLGYRAEFMGLASGKIGNYLKCGVPVITSKINSLKYVENYNCGVCVETAEDIYGAIEKISSNYTLFSQNALKCYNDLWKPDRSFKTILEKTNL